MERLGYAFGRSSRQICTGAIQVADLPAISVSYAVVIGYIDVSHPEHRTVEMRRGYPTRSIGGQNGIREHAVEASRLVMIPRRVLAVALGDVLRDVGTLATDAQEDEFAKSAVASRAADGRVDLSCLHFDLESVVYRGCHAKVGLGYRLGPLGTLNSPVPSPISHIDQ